MHFGWQARPETKGKPFKIIEGMHIMGGLTPIEKNFDFWEDVGFIYTKKKQGKVRESKAKYAWGILGPKIPQAYFALLFLVPLCFPCFSRPFLNISLFFCVFHCFSFVFHVWFCFLLLFLASAGLSLLFLAFVCLSLLSLALLCFCKEK